MNQIKLSNHFYSHKNRIIFSSKLTIFNRSHLPNPKHNLKKTNKVDILMNVQKQQEEYVHNILHHSFTTDPSQLLQVLEVAAFLHPFILHTILGVLDRKTDPECLRKFFEKYGENDEAKAIFDKPSGKSKGRGFVSFRIGMGSGGGGPGGQCGTLD